MLFALMPAGVLAQSTPWGQGTDAGIDPTLVAALAAKADAAGTVRIIVGLDLEFTPEGALRSPQAVSDQRLRIGRAQDEVLTGLAGLGAELIASYDFIPFMALAVDATALRSVAALPEVRSIEEDIAVPPSMASSNPVIGSPNAWAAGFTGSGQTVAVLDTGVDKTHPFFSTSDKVVSEACYSTTLASGAAASVCPGGSNSTAPGSGVNCPLEIGGCSHGTHVAGTVAGDDLVGPDFGVARGASIIAIQVFSYFEDCSCVKSYGSDQILGLQRVADLAGSFDIAAVNMSLGGGQYDANCDADRPSIKAAIDSLRALNIATVIAAGNAGFTDSMGAPACISTAVSVGATDDADNVAGFSNIAPFISLLAPGVAIDSSLPGGDVGTMGGTSMAAPHVAGAWAILRQKAPSLSVADTLAALRSTGTLVDDLRSGGIETDMPRINVDLALDSLSCGPDSFEPDNHSGQASTLHSGLSQSHNICPSGDRDWATFTLAVESEVTLETSGPSGDTVMWLRDAAGSAIDDDDDSGTGNFSLIDRTCGLDPLPAGTYFVEVGEYGDNDEIPTYDLSLTAAACDGGGSSPCGPTEVCLLDGQYAASARFMRSGVWHPAKPMTALDDQGEPSQKTGGMAFGDPETMSISVAVRPACSGGFSADWAAVGSMDLAQWELTIRRVADGAQWTRQQDLGGNTSGIDQGAFPCL